MILSKLKENLKKTKENLNIKLSNIFANKKDIEEILEQLEETLILSDVGAMTSAKICDEVREGLKLQQDKSEEAIKNLIKKNIGVSVLANSVCLKEVAKHSLVALPVENVSMIRETTVVYHNTFTHPEVIARIAEAYRTISQANGK